MVRLLSIFRDRRLDLSGAGGADPVQVANPDVTGEALNPVPPAGRSNVFRPTRVVDREHHLAGVAQGSRVVQVLRAEVLLARFVGGLEEQLLHADAVDRLGVSGILAQLGGVLRDDPDGGPLTLGVRTDPRDQSDHLAGQAVATLPRNQGQVQLLVRQRRVQVDPVEPGPDRLVDPRPDDPVPPAGIPVPDEVLVGPVRPAVDDQIPRLRVLRPERLDAADLEVGEDHLPGPAERVGLVRAEEVGLRVPGKIDDGDLRACAGQRVEAPVRVALELVHPSGDRRPGWLRPEVRGGGGRRRGRSGPALGRGPRRAGRRGALPRMCASRRDERHRERQDGDRRTPAHHRRPPTPAVERVVQIACTESVRSWVGRHPRPSAARVMSARIQSTAAERADGGPASRISPVNAAARASSSTASRAVTARPLPTLTTRAGTLGTSTAATTARATSRASTKSRCAVSGPMVTTSAPSTRASRRGAAARPSRVSPRSPGPIGLNTRSVTPSTRPDAPANSTRRVAARWLSPYSLTGTAGSSSVTDRPKGTRPYSPADPSRMRRMAGSTLSTASISLAVTRVLASMSWYPVPSRLPVQLTTAFGVSSRSRDARPSTLAATRSQRSRATHVTHSTLRSRSSAART